MISIVHRRRKVGEGGGGGGEERIPISIKTTVQGPHSELLAKSSNFCGSQKKSKHSKCKCGYLQTESKKIITRPTPLNRPGSRKQANWPSLIPGPANSISKEPYKKLASCILHVLSRLLPLPYPLPLTKDMTFCKCLPLVGHYLFQRHSYNV